MISYFSDKELEGIALPERFTFPFFYEPHPLSVLASKKLQHYLEHEFTLDHNFGLNENQAGLVIGKMFGVLVVKDSADKVGYLWGFSGKLAGTNEHDRFVPPVFDMLTENSFFLREVEGVNAINAAVFAIESSEDFQTLSKQLEALNGNYSSQIDSFKALMRKRKNERHAARILMKSMLDAEEYAIWEKDIIKESVGDKRKLAELQSTLRAEIKDIELKLSRFTDKLDSLKQSRKELSAHLQQQLFDQYYFLNQKGEKKSLGDIFKETVFGRPPAAAGECATPKLLQYAFLKGYKPLAMAEFWWGASPKSEIRKHQHFYPACTGKCEPILKHMLKYTPIEDNPFLENTGKFKDIEVLYEDDVMIVVNKPHGLLSVPGIHIQDSVYTRIKNMLSKDEPLVVHRLDMATSGILVFGKNREAHKNLQRQFIARKVEKRYTAILDGLIPYSEGTVDLPLRGDLEDRPRQLVCFEYGKKAVTRYQVVEVKDNQTRIHIWPITGRTHQLRMHAAHVMGLNCAIKGDELYGKASDRLYLHAAYLSLYHPQSKEKMEFISPDPF